MLVVGGVVALHIDAVEHAGELIAALAHDAVQPVGKVGHLQLVGIGGRHGVHRVGAQNSRLQQVHVAVHHDGAILRPAVVQAEQVAQGVLAEAALVLDIVDAEGGLDAAELLFPDAVVLQINGHQGGLPIVAVDDVGPEGQVGQHPHHSPGEKSEALTVVIVAVQVRAVEVLLVVHEVPGDAVPFQGKQSAVAAAPGQVHIVVAQEVQLVAELFLHLLVHGQDHGHLGALGGQGGRQGAGHVGQSAGFAEGHSLTGRIQDLHKILLFNQYSFGNRFPEYRDKGGTDSPPFSGFTQCCPWPARWGTWRDPSGSGSPAPPRPCRR